MDRQALINELTGILSDYIKNQGLDLIDVIYRYEGRDLFLRILVDRPQGGISLDECARLNNEIGRILDEKDIMQTRFILEVSSPGVDRPLKTKKDFLRCLDREVRFYLSESIRGKIEVRGRITKVGDESLCVEIDGEIVEISLDKINTAKQALDNI
jgi:ribosome maturation factor RimP